MVGSANTSFIFRLKTEDMDFPEILSSGSASSLTVAIGGASPVWPDSPGFGTGRPDYVYSLTLVAASPVEMIGLPLKFLKLRDGASDLPPLEFLFRQTRNEALKV